MELNEDNLPEKGRLVLVQCSDLYYRLCVYCGNWIFESYDTGKEMKGDITDWWYPEHLTEENKRLEALAMGTERKYTTLQKKYNDLKERARAAFKTFWSGRSVTWHDLYSNVKKIESDIFQDEPNQQGR